MLSVKFVGEFSLLFVCSVDKSFCGQQIAVGIGSVVSFQYKVSKPTNVVKVISLVGKAVHCSCAHLSVKVCMVVLAY